MIRHVAFTSGCHVTTVEGLGNATKPHVVQQRVAEFHGSQCLSADPRGSMGRTGWIHLHVWFKFMVNVGEYTSPMDPMGIEMGGERGRLYLMQI